MGTEHRVNCASLINTSRRAGGGNYPARTSIGKGRTRWACPSPARGAGTYAVSLARGWGLLLLVHLGEPVGVGIGGGLDPGSDAELGVDVVHVALDGAHAEDQLVGDLAGAPAPC